jgi:hypothetical protein
MPRIITTVHDAAALAATCRRLGLSPAVEGTAHLAEEVFGWVVRLPGLRFPIVCDTLTGLIAYPPVDNAHDRYAHIMWFVEWYYDIWAALQRNRCVAARNGRQRVLAKEGA